jgi:hypothetical protein
VIGCCNSEEIRWVIDSFARENDTLIKQLNQIQYYSRGAINRTDAWSMCATEREQIIDFINDRIKDAGEMIKRGISVYY